MAEADPPRPLTDADDRTAFDCGQHALNTWFKRHALRNHLGGASRVSVVTDRASSRIAGYVALSAAQIEREFLAKPHQRNLPDRVPVTLLGQLAVDKDFQGRGYASALLVFALRTALRASEAIGSLGVVTHPIDDGVRLLYHKWDFEELPFDPERAMMIRMTVIRKSLGP